MISDTPLEAFRKVSMDYVGLIPTTPSGNRHLLTMQCYLTKFLIAIPLPDIRATTIADVLARHLICQFGAPKALLSDQGRFFLADVIAEMLKLFKIKYLITSSYSPTTNGMLERSHAPLLDFIRANAEDYNDWDRLAPFACFRYNMSTHNATAYTPFELEYGALESRVCSLICHRTKSYAHITYICRT